MQHKKIVSILALAGLSMATASFAATATTTMLVSATVPATCSISAASEAFGNIDPSANTPVNGQPGTMTVQCTSGAGYSIAAAAGNNGGNATTGRIMNSGANQLTYALYTDAARTNYWGTTATHEVTGIGTGAAVVLPVYGQINGGQAATAKALTYNDSVPLTITF